MKKYNVSESDHKENLFIATALVGASMVIIIQLINQKISSIELNIAIYCFAVSIPLLVGSIGAMYMEKPHKIRASIWYISICNFFGCLLSLVGIGAVFFNFNKILGFVFVAASIYAFIAIGFYNDLLSEINKKN